jgi:hypothetical protein
MIRRDSGGICDKVAARRGTLSGTVRQVLYWRNFDRLERLSW